MSTAVYHSSPTTKESKLLIENDSVLDLQLLAFSTNHEKMILSNPLLKSTQSSQPLVAISTEQSSKHYLQVSVVKNPSHGSSDVFPSPKSQTVPDLLERPTSLTDTQRVPADIIKKHRHQPSNPRHSAVSSSLASPRSTITQLSHPTVDLGTMSLEEREALKIEITSRRVTRRTAQRRKDSDELQKSMDQDEIFDDRVQFGTRVAEGHRNYVLMYDMLTGIRIAVGRVSAKPKRDIVQGDFMAAHKLVFDV